MLWTIAVILLILWLAGMITSYTLNGFIHILLVLAIIAVLVSLLLSLIAIASGFVLTYTFEEDEPLARVVAQYQNELPRFFKR